ncbi:MAG: PAS domain-containing methyl-accepting chemotaxis protein, partial [Gallionella sp.]
MQNKHAYVSQKEVAFPAKAVLISRTDIKGITTYANEAFVALSGYSREELIGKSHNLVRHPDMPPQAFKWLWDTLKDGRPWSGTVKNRCKNGDHYWVRAIVAPIYENGSVVGYSSVRRPPTRDQINSADALYKQLNASGEQIESKYEGFKLRHWSLGHKLQFAIQATLFVVTGLGQYYLFDALKENAKQDAIKNTQQIATSIIDGANMLMVGGQINDIGLRKLLLEKVRSNDEVKSAALIRTKIVADKFGPGLPEEQISNDLQRHVIDTKKQNIAYDPDKMQLHVVTPYLASTNFHGTDCTGCHSAQEGEVLGVSDLVMSVEADMGAIKRLELLTLAGQIALQIFLFLYIGFLVKKYVSHPARIADQEFKKLMQGDMSDEINISSRDELGRLLGGIQTMQSYLRTVVDEIVTPIASMQKRIADVDERVSGVAGNAVNEQEHIQQIARTMEEFSQSVVEVADMAAESLNDARAMRKVVDDNNRNMELSIDATSRVADTVQTSSKTIADLGVSIQKIGSIANAIKDIADQTNLLALNAAIEAARAGEQGRGFAVVADEVRKLAERTATSTKDIASTIGEIDAISAAAVKSMQGAVCEVETGIALIRKNGEGLKEIMGATVSVSERIEHIATASREQSAAGENMAKGLERVSSLADSNAQSAKEAKL